MRSAIISFDDSCGTTSRIEANKLSVGIEHGLLRSSFVPPAPIRELRDLTRYRKSLTEERTRAANRLHKVLQDAGIKVGKVSVLPPAAAMPAEPQAAPVAPSPVSEPSAASMIVTQTPAPGQKILAGTTVNFEVR